MKKLVSVVVLAAMTSVSSFAESQLFKRRTVSRFDGLFGAKFGERMPSNAAVIPAGDGTLVSELEPKEPEFVFQDYFASLLPQTHVIVGFIGVDTFKANELVKCNEAYDRCKKAVEARFGKKMTVIPPTESGVGEAQTVLRNCIVEVTNDRAVMLQSLKEASGGYLFRLFAFDAKAARTTIKQHEMAEKSIPPLEGLFGRQLGEKVPVSADETSLAEGWHFQTFEPEKKFLDFNIYAVMILPRSRKVGMVVAVQDFNERFLASECFKRVCQLLEKKFNQKMTDTSSNFSSTKPDADGEQIFKATTMSFPHSLRFIEVHCLRDVDDKVFRVRITASDQSLISALDSEKKALEREKSDKAALDAL